MTRPLALLAASLVAATALPTAAGAAAGGYYVATPAAQPARDSVMTRATVWHRQSAALVADRAGERPQVMCELLARSVGELTAFSAGGTALEADKLAKCTARSH